jgi:hypothetical protein
MGYLLHDHKTEANVKAVIISEANPEDGAKGGTGKGLILKSIDKLRKVNIIDGKAFSFDSPFCYQGVQLDTKILLFDDVKEKFDFSRLYSVITGGLSYEKKNRDRITLTLEESPKVAITTNYAIAGNDESDKRRKIEIELACYYNSKKTPIDEFGKLFFGEWNEEEWNDFYNILFRTVQEYLTSGVIPYASKIVEKKRILLEVDENLVEFLDDKQLTGEHNLQNLLDEYNQEFPKDNLVIQHFSRLVKKYYSLKNLSCVIKRKMITGKRVTLVTIK